MTTINIKPLSVNEAWKGRRFKTEKYLDYQNFMFFILPDDIYVPKGKIKLHIAFNFSSKSSDIDNCLKPLIDILQRKYCFNDKKIYKLCVSKNIVDKNNESISFEFFDID